MKNKKVKQGGLYPNIVEQDSHIKDDENEVKQYCLQTYRKQTKKRMEYFQKEKRLNSFTFTTKVKCDRCILFPWQHE